MKTKAIHMFLILLLALSTTTAFAAEKWIHVKVDGDDDEQVTVNLPLSLISAAAALIPEEARQDAQHEMEVAFDEFHLQWGELMKFWQEVKNAPEATFVTVQTRDEKIRVRKQGQFVLVETTEASPDGTQVDVRFPLAVIDALLSGPEGTLNFEAALNALADQGDGHIVSVRDGEQTVRIWIDEQNEAE